MRIIAVLSKEREESSAKIPLTPLLSVIKQATAPRFLLHYRANIPFHISSEEHWTEESPLPKQLEAQAFSLRAFAADSNVLPSSVPFSTATILE